MATTAKVLGQTGDASTEVSLYTVPASTEAKIKVSIANRAGTAATFRLAIVPNGGATGNQHYIAYDESIAANSSVTSTTLTADAGDVVRVLSSTSTVSFTAFGIEQT